MDGPGRPCSPGRSREPVYRSGGLSSMEAGRSRHIGFGDKNGQIRGGARMASPKAQRSLLRRSVRTQHEAVEVGGKLGMAVKRKHMRDILVRPHHDHAAFVPIDAAHRKDVVAALEIGAEHLFVVAKSVTSFCREKE